MLDPRHISCFMAIPGMAQRDVLASMERFGSKVMPAVARALRGREPAVCTA
jgi:hypothetical protein